MTAKANPPKVSHRICDECGHKQLVAADLAPDACPKCNKVYGRLRVGSRFAIPGGRQHGSTAPAPTGYRTRYARPDSVPRRLGELLVELGGGLVECQLEQLETAHEVALDAVAGKDPADGPARPRRAPRCGPGGARGRRPAARSPSPSSDGVDAPDRRSVGHRPGWCSTREGSLPFLDRQVALAVVVGRAERPEIAHVEERSGVAVVRRPVIDDQPLRCAAVLAAPAVTPLDGQDRPLPLRGAIARVADAALRGSTARAEPRPPAEQDGATRRAGASAAEHQR